ncbi:MAG: valine--pyruvate transaminase [Sedimentisphaerales bacterium]|nr:valine--pyruvate transaminase [Sedimentisphaerales bacterium]
MNISKFARRLAVQSGIGQLMDDLAVTPSADREVFMLGGGNPARVPQVEQHLRRSMEQTLADGDRFERIVGNYDPPAGNPGFLDAMAGMLRRQYGWDIGPQNVALTNGSQTLFFTLFNLFAGPCEDGTVKKILFPLIPEYIGYCDVGLAPDLFVANKPSIELVGDHLFKYHIDFDSLAISDEVGAICVSRPTNPTGNVLSDSELHRLSDLAMAKGVPLIVDSAYGTPFPNIMFSDTKPLWNENAIVCMSLSKLGLPGVRTGIVLARREIVEMVARVNAVMSLAPGGVGPAIITDLVRSGQIVRIGREIIRPFYRNKAQQVLEQIRECFKGVDYHVHQPEGAFFVWMWFPNLPITNQQLYERLKQRGVLIVPGHYFFPGLADPWPHATECLRVSYAQDPQIVSRGLEIIAEEVKRAYEILS